MKRRAQRTLAAAGAHCWIWLAAVPLVSASPSFAGDLAVSGDALPPLPRAVQKKAPAPSAEEQAELAVWLDALISNDRTQRLAALTPERLANARWVAAAHLRLHGIAEAAGRPGVEAMKRRHSELRRLRKRSEAEDTALLEVAIEEATPADPAWQRLTQVLALARLLRSVGTTPALRGLVDVYVRFGEFLRVETQKELAAVGHKAVPVLIETRRHPAEKIARWASRQLDQLGKAIATEAVQTEDAEVLADVLRAYGLVRDPDAARVVVSFASSERALVRQAAREAIATMGEVAHWQLRDQYERLLGTRPPRDWPFERTARELFHALDRIRLARVLERFEAGNAARSRGDLVAMNAAWEEVLARAPQFERASEMREGFLAFARKHALDHPDRARVAARRALRLASTESEAKQAEALLELVEARRLLRGGVADEYRFARARALAPEDPLAQTPLTVAPPTPLAETAWSRYGVAALIVGLSTTAALYLLMSRLLSPRVAPTPAPNQDDQPQPEPPPSVAETAAAPADSATPLTAASSDATYTGGAEAAQLDTQSPLTSEQGAATEVANASQPTLIEARQGASTVTPTAQLDTQSAPLAEHGAIDTVGDVSPSTVVEEQHANRTVTPTAQLAIQSTPIEAHGANDTVAHLPPPTIAETANRNPAGVTAPPEQTAENQDKATREDAVNTPA